MKLRLLTQPEPIKGEGDLISALFEAGLECLNLRKPDYNQQEYERLIKSIDSDYHNRIIVHQHQAMALKYRMKGVHIREQDRRNLGYSGFVDVIIYTQRAGMVIGTSIHDMETFQELPNTVDYCFVSPIFASISKKGYTPKVHWDINKIKGMHSYQIIGLGGVSADSLQDAQKLGFDEVGAVGAIWSEPKKAVETLKIMLEKCQSLDPTA